MKLVILSALALSLAAFSANAQATLEEITATPEKAGGVYYAYPVTESANTPAPKGYKPFYISHYGRHGSRFLISDRDYEVVLDRLRHADSAGALSPLGRDVLGRVEDIWQEARGLGGELTPLGNRQHRAIATRMYKSFPEVFADGAQMQASSTVVMRCAHSMFAFIEGLKEQNPRLEIPRTSGQRDMYFLNYHSPESGPYSSHDGPWYASFKRFRAAQTKPDRLVGSLFADSAYTAMWVDAPEFMWQLYWMAVDLQNMETEATLLDLFTPQELYDLWQVANFNFFACNSSYAPAEGHFTANARNLVRNIVADADSCLAGPDSHGARLRFGHDGNIIPLAALLRIPGSYSDIVDPAHLADEWADFKISPMAANLQIVLFRSADSSKPVLAKVMLNEREVALPLAYSAAGAPFYTWPDIRAYLLSL